MKSNAGKNIIYVIVDDVPKWNVNTSSHIHIEIDTGKYVVLISVIESKLDIYVLSSI